MSKQENTDKPINSTTLREARSFRKTLADILDPETEGHQTKPPERHIGDTALREAGALRGDEMTDELLSSDLPSLHPPVSGRSLFGGTTERNGDTGATASASDVVEGLSTRNFAAQGDLPVRHRTVVNPDTLPSRRASAVPITPFDGYPQEVSSSEEKGEGLGVAREVPPLLWDPPTEK